MLLSILLMAIAAIIRILVVSARILDLYLTVLLSVAWILGPTFCYTAMVVTVSMSHARLGTTIETWLEINRRKQRILLRILAWCWFPVVFGAQRLLSRWSVGP